MSRTLLLTCCFICGLLLADVAAAAAQGAARNLHQHSAAGRHTRKLLRPSSLGTQDSGDRTGPVNQREINRLARDAVEVALIPSVNVAESSEHSAAGDITSPGALADYYDYDYGYKRFVGSKPFLTPAQLEPLKGPGSQRPHNSIKGSGDNTVSGALADYYDYDYGYKRFVGSKPFLNPSQVKASDSKRLPKPLAKQAAVPSS